MTGLGRLEYDRRGWWKETGIDANINPASRTTFMLAWSFEFLVNAGMNPSLLGFERIPV
jgi:hypothetical protein